MIIILNLINVWYYKLIQPSSLRVTLSIMYILKFQRIVYHRIFLVIILGNVLLNKFYLNILDLGLLHCFNIVTDLSTPFIALHISIIWNRTAHHIHSPSSQHTTLFNILSFKKSRGYLCLQRYSGLHRQRMGDSDSIAK